MSLAGSALWLERSPLGPLWLELSISEGSAQNNHCLTYTDAVVIALHWGVPPTSHKVLTQHPYLTQLTEYFAGQRQVFSVPVKPFGTAFQHRVWRGLQNIPFGQTLSYGQLATRVGTHARPLGSANGCNPIPILIPCHRVVAHNFTGFSNPVNIKSIKGLGGFSAPGGLDTKVWLLRHESTRLAV